MDESLVLKYPDLERRHFWWATRRELVTDLVAGVGAVESKRVLDVGCGSGMTSRAIADLGASVIGVDLETHGGDDSSVEYVTGDYLSLSDGLGEFDLVLALDSIEHFEDEAKVVGALARNLRPGGRLIVTVPAYQFLWSSHDDTNVHYRRYTSRRLRKALDTEGLEVERIGYIFMALTLPKVVLSLWERLRSKSAPTGTEVGGWANRAAAAFFRLESRLARRQRDFLPLGTSVLAVARKPEDS